MTAPFDPELTEGQKACLRLRLGYGSRGPSLHVADAVRLNTRGQAAVSKSKTGRGQVTAPIFRLVRQVKLPKRLDLARDEQSAGVDGTDQIVSSFGFRVSSFGFGPLRSGGMNSEGAKKRRYTRFGFRVLGGDPGKFAGAATGGLVRPF